MPQEHRARLRAVYGLDLTLPEQYLRWIGGVARGEWGYSLSQHRPVGQILRESAPKTLLLSSAALVLELGLGLALGVAAAARAGTFADRAIRALSIALWSLPTFWFGLIPSCSPPSPSPGPSFPPARCARSTPTPTAWAAARSISSGTSPCLQRLSGCRPRPPPPASCARRSSSGWPNRSSSSGRARGLSPHRVLWSHALRAGLAPLAQLAGLSTRGAAVGHDRRRSGLRLARHRTHHLRRPGRARLSAAARRNSALRGLRARRKLLLAEALQTWLDPRLRDA